MVGRFNAFSYVKTNNVVPCSKLFGELYYVTTDFLVSFTLDCSISSENNKKDEYAFLSKKKQINSSINYAHAFLINCYVEKNKALNQLCPPQKFNCEKSREATIVYKNYHGPVDKRKSWRKVEQRSKEMISRNWMDFAETRWKSSGSEK